MRTGRANMAASRRHLLWVVLAGACAQAVDEPDPPSPYVVPPIPTLDDAITVQSSPIDPTALAAFATGPAHTVSIRADTVGLYPLTVGVVEAYPSDESLISAITLNDDTWVSTASGVFRLADGIDNSPFSQAALPPIDTLYAGRDALWLESDEQLFLWRSEQLTELNIDGQSIPGPMVIDGSRTNQPAAWIATHDGILGVDDTLEAMAWVDFPDQVIDAMAVDSSGALWLAHDGQLDVWDGTDIRHAELDGVFDVKGSPLHSQVWVRTFAGAWVGTTDGLAPIPPPPGQWAGLDGSGSLLHVSDDGLMQVSAEYTSSIVGISGTVTASQPFAIAASHRDSVVSATVTIGDGAPQLLSEPPWAFDLDVRDLNGATTLVSEVGWADGTRTHAERVIQVIAGDITWQDHVQPMAQVHCSQCHGEDAGSDTPLFTSEQWIATFPSVLSEVESGGMPLVGDSLTPDQVDILQGWQATGFR